MLCFFHMSKNPFLNAVLASAYIGAIAIMMDFATRLSPGPDLRIITPFAMISLFTLSAAVMGYLFLSAPIQLYLAGDKKKAVMLFLQTVAVFGGITVIALGFAFFGAR